MQKLFRRNQKGFTLVELVVVIAILGILAAIAVPRFVSTLNEAEATADAATVRAVQGAVDIYYLENGSYPTLTQLENGNYLDDTPTLNDGVLSIDENGIVHDSVVPD